MSYNQTPQKFRFHTVVSMNYPVSCVNNFTSIRNFKGRVHFSYTVDSFSHYLGLTFDSAYSQSVFFKHIKSFGKIRKESFQFRYRIKYVLKMFQNIFISHKSIVWYGLYSE